MLATASTRSLSRFIPRRKKSAVISDRWVAYIISAPPRSTRPRAQTAAASRSRLPRPPPTRREHRTPGHLQCRRFLFFFFFSLSKPCFRTTTFPNGQAASLSQRTATTTHCNETGPTDSTPGLAFVIRDTALKAEIVCSQAHCSGDYERLRTKQDPRKKRVSDNDVHCISIPFTAKSKLRRTLRTFTLKNPNVKVITSHALRYRASYIRHFGQLGTVTQQLRIFICPKNLYFENGFGLPMKC